MNTKNYTQVLIDGKIYTLGGSEDESYLQKTASYVNDKIAAIRKIPGFSKQSADYQTAMIELNLADDYFKAQERAGNMERLKNDMEKETYSLKHELVSTQMKLEAVLKDLEVRQRQMEELTRRADRLEMELKQASRAAVNASEEAAAAQESAEALPEQQGAEGGSEPYGSQKQPENSGWELSQPGGDGQSGTPRLSDAELAKKALQAARKANSHKGRR